MASLTGAGSTSALQQNTPQKPKSSLLWKIKEKISSWAKKAKTAISSPEAKAVIETAKSPLQIIKEGTVWKNWIIAQAWKAWDYLSKIWKQAETTKIPVISQAWSITRAAWDIISWPEKTKQNVIEIWNQVKKWEISMFDWILEASTSVWLQWVTLIWAPYVQAINSWLNTTWLDEALNKSVESWTEFLTSVTADLFWMKDSQWNPTPEARSRVNSALNILRWAAMYKWSIVGNKWWVWNFVKWSAITSSPDLLLSVIAFWAKEDWVDVPNPEKMKWAIANAATAFIPLSWMKTKPAKNQLWIDFNNTKESVTKPLETSLEKPTASSLKEKAKKTVLNTEEKMIVKDSQSNIKPLESSVIEPSSIAKKVKLTAQEKKARNETYKEFEQLAWLQETKSNIWLWDLVMTKEQSYNEKKRLIDSLISKWYIIKDWVDKKWERFAFTQKAKDDFNIGWKNSGLKFVKDLVHLPQNSPTTKVSKTNLPKKASEKIKTKKTSETDVVLDTIVEKTEPTTTAIEKVEQKPTTTAIEKVEPTTWVDETWLKRQSDLVKKSRSF